MGPIEDALIEAFFPALSIREEVSTEIREIPGHSVKHIGLGLKKTWLSAQRSYKTSKSSSKALVGSLLGVNDLKYIYHKSCIRSSNMDTQKQWECLDREVITRQKDLSDRSRLNPLR